MGLSITVLIALSSLLFSSVNADCNHDNCYRALFPAQSPAALSTAATFCSSLLQGANPAYPTRATSACGASPSPYSSACSCSPTATPTPTPGACSTGGLVANPSFECGTDGWQFQLQPGTTWKLSSPGSTGQFAFEFDQVSPVPSGGFHFAQARLLQAIYPLDTTTKYTLSFSTNITPGGAGFWGVMIDCKGLMTVDAMDAKGPGVWNTWNTSFVPASAQALLSFEILASGPGAAFRIDDITIQPAA